MSKIKNRPMKKTAIIFIYICLIFQAGKAQTTRFFEFSVICGAGNWQDTSFIASASDQVLIDSVLANLARPLNQRKFINGPITYGHGGHNHNADHWFLWHFIPDQWDLVEEAIELCDGCPYTDIDLDTAYWVGIVGQFCPWSGRPVREVSDPVLSINDPVFENEVMLFPNPANDVFKIKWAGINELTVSIYNSIGQLLHNTNDYKQHDSINISNLPSGLYVIKINTGHKSTLKKLIKE
jgi:hypothetical protein